MIYPNGRTVHYNYGTGAGAKLNRVDNLASEADTTDSAKKFGQYAYLGSATPVELSYPAVTNQPKLTRLKDSGSGTDPYQALDRFGRVTDQWWKNSSADLDRFTYGYDNSSNRTWRQNEKTHGATPKLDEAYSYDGLDRLTAMKRGELDSSHVMPASPAPVREKLYALNQVGNWATLTEKANGSDTLVQLRKHNQVNEIDNDNDHTNAVGTGNDYPLRATTGNNWIAPRYDAAGNMTSGPKPSVGSGPATEETTRQHFTYDAWNRLVKVQADNGGGSPGDTVGLYRYDGLHRRVAKLLPNAVHTSNYDRTDYYYNESWQCLEERFCPDGSETNIGAAKVQYVWDLRYIDSVICRDRDATGDSALEERLYYTADANFNVTGLISASNGNIVERYTYDDYGKVTFRQSDWSVTGSDGTASGYGNEILYCGYRYDSETRYYQARNREYLPSLGRMGGRDRTDGLATVASNLYEYAFSSPVTFVDPTGYDVETVTYIPDPIWSPYRGRISEYDVETISISYEKVGLLGLECNRWQRLQIHPSVVSMARTVYNDHIGSELPEIIRRDHSVYWDPFDLRHYLWAWENGILVDHGSATAHRLNKWFAVRGRTGLIGRGGGLDRKGARAIHNVTERLYDQIFHERKLWFTCECWCDDMFKAFGFVRPGSKIIHLCPRFFGEVQGEQALTLIHEGTHAFAGTKDFGYWSGGGRYVKYDQDGQPYRVELNMRQRVGNADTYMRYLEEGLEL